MPNQDVKRWSEHYQGSGYVYRNIRVLYRTEQYLKKREILVFPYCYRDAIEFVHDEQAYPDEPVELTDIYDIVGKIKTTLEANKKYEEYWYISDVEGVDYEKTEIERAMKIARISWNCKRRVPRTD